MTGDLVEVYLGQLDHIAATVDSVDPRAPTELGDWDAITLVGHIATGVETLWRWAGEPRETPPLDTAAYWGPAAAVAGLSADWATKWAAQRTAEAIVEIMQSNARRARDLLTRADPTSAIVPPLGDGWITLDDFLGTRLVEATVHGLDLEIAGCGVGATDDAVAAVGGILDRVLDDDRPPDLADARTWLLAATGRIDHDDPRLPVLS